MKTIVVLSDTHCNTAPLVALSRVLEECDYIVHLGDMTADADRLRTLFPEKTFVVKGNNDFGGGVDELVLDIEGRRIFACHGHRYGVKQTTRKLLAAAKSKLCDVVLYGHTHESLVREEEGVLLVNPGCMTTYAPARTYAYLVIHDEKAVATIVPVSDSSKNSMRD